MGNLRLTTLEAADRLNRILASISYKPGWEFRMLDPRLYSGSAFDVQGDMVRLEIVAKVPDAYDPAKVIPIRYGYSFNTRFCDSDDYIKNGIFDAIMGLERHETLEFLKFGGKHHIDPHSEGR